MAPIAKVQPSRLILSPKAMQKALQQSDKQSQRMAAIAVMGRSANGWVEWKTEQGQTLDSAKRQSVRVVGNE